MLVDYHIHTSLCRHACGNPEDYVKTALDKDIAEIGFSDHSPYPAGHDSRFRMHHSEFPLYKKTVLSLRAKFAKPAIKFGIEIDWVPGRMDEAFSILRDEPFDYFTGSIHYTDEFPFDNPEIEHEWRKNGAAGKVWRRYISLMKDMVSSGRFNIIGHFDLPKKFGYYPDSMDEINNSISEICKIAASNGTAIEINTSGLRKPVGEIYPSPDILKRAFKEGVPITFGSDAHSPSEVGADFSKALTLAKQAGYSEYCTFTEKTPLKIPLP
jgi:histidinol-phosphatase (PHP family)